MKAPICRMCKVEIAVYHSPYALVYGSNEEPFDACEECNISVKEVLF